jgi:hypothetical protein
MPDLAEVDRVPLVHFNSSLIRDSETQSLGPCRHPRPKEKAFRGSFGKYRDKMADAKLFSKILILIESALPSYRFNSSEQSPGAEGGASSGRQEGQGFCEEEDGTEEDCS